MTDSQLLSLFREALLYADSSKQPAADKMMLTSTLADVGIESIIALEMAAYIENKLDIQFPDDELSAIFTVSGFADLVRKYAVEQVAG